MQGQVASVIADVLVAVVVVTALVAGWRQWRSGALSWTAEREAEERADHDAIAAAREFIERAGVRSLNR